MCERSRRAIWSSRRFAWSDGTCEFCQQGLQTSCLHGGWWGGTELDGGQGEAVRVPLADGTLVALRSVLTTRSCHRS
jgi:threonine dehydrogenase-like Zn-dependent dehydrogenase